MGDKTDPKVKERSDRLNSKIKWPFAIFFIIAIFVAISIVARFYQDKFNDLYTPALYLFSTIAQTMGALLGIGLAILYTVISSVKITSNNLSLNASKRLLLKDRFLNRLIVLGLITIIISIISIAIIFFTNMHSLILYMINTLILFTIGVTIITMYYLYYFIRNRIILYTLPINLLLNDCFINGNINLRLLDKLNEDELIDYLIICLVDNSQEIHNECTNRFVDIIISLKLYNTKFLTTLANKLYIDIENLGANPIHFELFNNLMNHYIFLLCDIFSEDYISTDIAISYIKSIQSVVLFNIEKLNDNKRKYSLLSSYIDYISKYTLFASILTYQNDIYKYKNNEYNSEDYTLALDDCVNVLIMIYSWLIDVICKHDNILIPIDKYLKDKNNVFFICQILLLTKNISVNLDKFYVLKEKYLTIFIYAKYSQYRIIYDYKNIDNKYNLMLFTPIDSDGLTENYSFDIIRDKLLKIVKKCNVNNKILMSMLFLSNIHIIGEEYLYYKINEYIYDFIINNFDWSVNYILLKINLINKNKHLSELDYKMEVKKYINQCKFSSQINIMSQLIHNAQAEKNKDSIVKEIGDVINNYIHQKAF